MLHRTAIIAMNVAVATQPETRMLAKRPQNTKKHQRPSKQSSLAWVMSPQQCSGRKFSKKNVLVLALWTAVAHSENMTENMIAGNFTKTAPSFGYCSPEKNRFDHKMDRSAMPPCCIYLRADLLLKVVHAANLLQSMRWCSSAAARSCQNLERKRLQAETISYKIHTFQPFAHGGPNKFSREARGLLKGLDKLRPSQPTAARNRSFHLKHAGGSDCITSESSGGGPGKGLRLLLLASSLPAAAIADMKMSDSGMAAAEIMVLLRFLLFPRFFSDDIYVLASMRPYQY